MSSSLARLPLGSLCCWSISGARRGGRGELMAPPKCVGAILKGVAPEMVKFRGCRVTAGGLGSLALSNGRTSGMGARINGAPKCVGAILKGVAPESQISRMSRPRRLSLQTLPVALGVLAVSDGRTSGMGAINSWGRASPRSVSSVQLKRRLLLLGFPSGIIR